MRVLEPYADRFLDFSGPGCLLLARLAAVINQWPAAERRYRDALQMCAASAAQGWSARVLLDYASMLAERGGRVDRTRALELAQRAQAEFLSLGLDFRAGEAGALLRSLGGGAAVAPSATRPAGLSARELEVLLLLARGRTNREIAVSLYISQNTVIRHVAHIYAKIGAANRAEAATFAARHNLVT
jgi:DNA-binding CsgD family transcriptional regulator